MFLASVLVGGGTDFCFLFKDHVLFDFSLFLLVLHRTSCPLGLPMKIHFTPALESFFLGDIFVSHTEGGIYKFVSNAVFVGFLQFAE